MHLTPKQYAHLCSMIMEALGGQTLPPVMRDSLEAQLATGSKSDRSEALQGVKQMIFASVMLPRERRSKIDVWLASNSLPTLDALSDEFENREEGIVPTVLSRGRILDEEEYGAVMNELNDMTSDLSDEQRISLGNMLKRFDER